MANSNIISNVSGRAVPVRGADIDTDRIIPARYLRCVTFDGLGAHAFEDDKQQDPSHSFNQAKYDGANILIAGRNFGCGSSREHAPQSLAKWGITGIVGESFAEIFYGNCVAIGVPCVRLSVPELEALYAAVEADSSLVVSIDVAAGTVSYGDKTVQGDLPEGLKSSFLKGTWNATAVLLEAEKAIEETAARIPYVSGF